MHSCSFSRKLQSGLRPDPRQSPQAPTVVPALIPYSGIAIGAEGKLLTGEISATFLIYPEEQGGEPLFTEVQTFTPDSAGKYSIQLGASLSSGIPINLFSTGEARWLEVQIAGQPPQPRTLLASVPYAVKAADAATLGGLPASAFVLAGTKSSTSVVAATTPDTATDVTTTGGVSGYLAEFSGASTIVDSPIFVDGADVGIGTATPAATFDVNGSALVSGALTAGGVTANGALEMAPIGTATASTGYDSQALKIYTSAYNSTSKTVVNPRFEWQALVTGNDTAAPSATLNLLSSTTAATATQTGFYFNTNGTMNFAPGQTFPGTGLGTITGVTAGAGLTGGGTSGNITLAVNPATIPELASANSFTASQTITSGDLNLPATTSALSGVINIGGRPFLHGYTSGNANTFVGGAGNFTTTGSHLIGVGLGALSVDAAGTDNTASGWAAGLEISSGNYNSGFGSTSLFNITTGSYNTAMGYGSDGESLTGSYNTGIGAYSLDSLTTGNENTALGYGASPGTTSGAIDNSVALGAFATVSQSNSMVLGQTYQGKPGFDFINVGIGTDKPRSTLEAAVDTANSLGPVLTLTNSGSGTNTAAAVDFNTYLPSTSGTYNPGARIEAIDDGFNDYGTNLFFYLNKAGGANNGLQTDMVINSAYGAVGIGVTDPQSYGYQLMVEATTGEDGIFGLGSTTSSSYASSGVIGQGGDNSSASYGAGTGGAFFGGYSYGSAAGGDGVEGVGGGSGSGSVGYAGHFYGNVEVTGTLNGSTPEVVKIDHPLDPANKYLVHSSVQSSEMMNIYSGNVVTDELGLATVQLPDWFEAENGDFRYQLTVVDGRFVQAVISKEIANHQFAISTNASHVKVSWQVTAVREDASAKANPLVVEQQKPADERGFYIHPELYGQPQEKQTEWGRHPQQMQRMNVMREKQKLQGGAAQTATALSHDQPASAVNRQFARQAKPVPKPIPAAKP